MQSKLTLRLGDDLIRQAKRHADRTGRSLSRMVADYFELLGSNQEAPELPPLVRSLKGMMVGSGIDEQDYRDYLEKKHA